MAYLKLSLKSLLKRKLSVFLMIIQLIVSYWMINNAYLSIEVLKNQESRILHYSNFDMEKTMRLVVLDGDDTEWFSQRFSQLEMKIRDLPEVEGYGAFFTTSLAPKKLPNQESYIEKNQELYSGSRFENFYDFSRMIYFDYDVYKHTKFSVAKGRNLEKHDFEKADGETIPVLIGYNYKDVIEIGDQFEASIDGNYIAKFEVIGVIEKGAYWLSGNDYYIDPPDRLDSFIISPYFPYSRQSKPIDVAVRLHNSFIQIDSVSNFERLKETVEKIGEDLGIHPTLRTIKMDLEKYKAASKPLNDFTLYMGIFFLTVSIIGVITVFLSSIYSRKKELAVRLITGFNKFDITILISIEIVLTIVFSALIGVMLSYYFEATDNFLDYNVRLEAFTPSFFTKIVLTTVAIALIAIIIPIKKIKKMQLIQLLGGRE